MTIEELLSQLDPDPVRRLLAALMQRGAPQQIPGSGTQIDPYLLPAVRAQLPEQALLERLAAARNPYYNEPFRTGPHNAPMGVVPNRAEEERTKILELLASAPILQRILAVPEAMQQSRKGLEDATTAVQRARRR